MVKWVKYLGGGGEYSYDDMETGGVYKFNKQGKYECQQKGTAMPDALADNLVKTRPSEFEFVALSEWHLGRKAEKENAMLEAELQKMPSDIREMVKASIAANKAQPTPEPVIVPTIEPVEVVAEAEDESPRRRGRPKKGDNI